MKIVEKTGKQYKIKWHLEEYEKSFLPIKCRPKTCSLIPFL